jgi:2-iminobutanoate/2-iminopropanoate deaminase
MRNIIKTDTAPLPKGAYSQAIEVDGFVFASGQISVDAKSNEIVPGTIEEETERTLNNLKNVLTAAGCSMQDVVKCTVYLSDISEFAKMNAVYGEYFGEGLPARAALGCQLMAGLKVEIDAVARHPKT